MMAPKELDEKELQSLLAKNINQYFALLVEKYIAELYGYAYRLLGDRQDAEDVVQDALLSAYHFLKSNPTDTFPTYLRGWLRAILRNKCVDAIRIRKRKHYPVLLETVTEDVAEDIEERDPQKNPEMVSESAELMQELLASMSNLPTAYQETAYLHFLEGRSASEIAQTLGKPLTTIKSQIHRSRKLLLKALQVEREREYRARSDP